MKRSQRFLLYGAALAVLIVVIVAVLALGGGNDGGGSGKDASEYPYEVQRVEPLESRDHLTRGETFDGYNSNPPTSGPHSPNVAEWGVSDTVVAKEVAVHNMEHAGVIVWYNCAGGPQPLGAGDCAGLRDDLSRVVQPEVDDGKHVVMTPYPGMDNRIALTAWGYLDTFGEFDAARVGAFIDVFDCLTDLENLC